MRLLNEPLSHSNKAHVLSFIYVCWDTALCFSLFQDITLFISLVLAEERKSCTYTPEQYALQGSFLSNPSRWHRNKREMFSKSFLRIRILSLMCLISCPACIFPICEEHQCHSKLRADQPVGLWSETTQIKNQTRRIPKKEGKKKQSGINKYLNWEGSPQNYKADPPMTSYLNRNFVQKNPDFWWP